MNRKIQNVEEENVNEGRKNKEGSESDDERKIQK